MSLNANILNAEYFSISKISNNVDLYMIGKGDGKFFKFQKNIWNTNTNWSSTQQEIKTIQPTNYSFKSASQIHTGQIIAIGNDNKLYLIDSNFINAIELKYNNLIMSFNSVTQLSNYKILLVGIDGNPYCIDIIKNPIVYKINQPGLTNLNKLKQQGFS